MAPFFSEHKKVKHPSPKRIVVRIDPPTKKQRLNDDHDYFDDDEYGSNIGYETQPTEEGGLLKRKCTKCNFSAKYPYDIFLHGINVHKRCTKCNEDFADKKGIMDHLSTVHCERVQCDMCDFQGFPAFQLVSYLFHYGNDFENVNVITNFHSSRFIKL